MGFWSGVKKEIARVKIVGVRTAEDTKVLGTYNYGVYSLLVQYTDGSIELVEEKADSKRMQTYLPYVQW